MEAEAGKGRRVLLLSFVRILLEKAKPVYLQM